MPGHIDLPDGVHLDEGTQYFLQNFGASSTRSPFRPLNEPHRSLYVALQAEASKRAGRTPESATAAEIAALHRAALTLAPQYGLPSPTLDQVTAAETYASGSTDYQTTWVYALLRILRASVPSPQQATSTTQLRSHSLNEN